MACVGGAGGAAGGGGGGHENGSNEEESFVEKLRKDLEEKKVRIN